MFETIRQGVKFQAKSDKELFEMMAHVDEVFGHHVCGMCGSENLRYVVREDDEGNKYYEVKCLDCGARLSFGQVKKPENGCFLFPRKAEEKDNVEIGKDRRWHKWLGNNNNANANAKSTKKEVKTSNRKSNDSGSDVPF